MYNTAILRLTQISQVTAQAIGAIALNNYLFVDAGNGMSVTEKIR